MPDEVRIPIVEEQAHVGKRTFDAEHVRVRTTAVEEDVLVRDTLNQQRVEITRVPIDREVAQAPVPRTEGEVTIVPVVEERLIVEKRLFVVEEVHMRLTTESEPVAVPMTLRRTRVDVERTRLDQQENH